MMQWQTLLQKELAEDWHNKQWIWVPLVFIIIMIMDPLTYYFLPEIMEMAGNVPEEMQFDIPDMTGNEAIMLSLSQVSMLGSLVVSFIFMSIVHGERKSGTIEMTLAKPISTTNFLTAKFVSALLLIVLSLFVASLLAVYYVSILFSSISWQSFFLIVFFYSLWFIFIITLTLFYSSFTRTAGAVIGLTIGTLALMYLINQIFQHKLTYFPNQIAYHVEQFLHEQTWSSGLTGSLIVILTLIILLLASAIAIFRKREIL